MVQGLQKTFGGTTKKCENKNLSQIFILIQLSKVDGAAMVNISFHHDDDDKALPLFFIYHFYVIKYFESFLSFFIFFLRRKDVFRTQLNPLGGALWENSSSQPLFFQKPVS